jgi:hypothetical protein
MWVGGHWFVSCRCRSQILLVFALIYNYSNQRTPLEIKDGRTEVGPVAEAEEAAVGEGPISGVYETWAAPALKWVEDEAGSGASL